MKRALLFLLSISAFGAAIDLKVTPSSRTNATVSTFYTVGEGFLLTRHLKLEAKLSDGRSREYELILLFDRATGCFQSVVGLWPELRPNPLGSFTGKQAAVYSSAEGIVVFFLDMGRLDVLDSKQNAFGLDDAENQSLARARQVTTESPKDMSPAWRQVPLTLSTEFWAPPFSAIRGAIKILGVSKTGKGWTLLIQGQWKVQLTLNEKYEVVSAEKVQ
jgi:hypothetical protein